MSARAPSSERFGERLKRLRNAAGMSQEKLAREADVSRQTVYNAERGDSIPELATAWALADALALTLDELVGREPPKARAAPEPHEVERFNRLSSARSRAARQPRRGIGTAHNQPDVPCSVNLITTLREDVLAAS